LGRVQSATPFIGLVFGGSNFPEGFSNLPEIRRLGFVRCPSDQAVAYSAMNMLVLPSLDDNLPQSGLEAMACGTPVVAFATGGIPDYVRHGETGLLARTGDEEELAAGIKWLVERPDAAIRMGCAAREMTIRDFGLENQARAYLDLYRQLLDECVQSRHKRAA
jgi:glycosyltransferase involved in cell wall biosynthesis